MLPICSQKPTQRHQGRGTDTRVGRQAWTSPRNRRGRGALDAHMGPWRIRRPGILTRIMGTSTCDIMVASKDEVGGRCIKGNLRPGGRFGEGIRRFRSRTVGFRRHLRLVQEDAGMDTERYPRRGGQAESSGRHAGGTHP